MLCSSSPKRYSSMTSIASAYCARQIAPIEAMVMRKFSSKMRPCARFFTVVHTMDAATDA